MYLMNLLKQDEKLRRFASSLDICHTKAITALVEYGTPGVCIKLLILTLSWSFGMHLD